MRSLIQAFALSFVLINVVFISVSADISLRRSDDGVIYLNNDLTILQALILLGQSEHGTIQTVLRQSAERDLRIRWVDLPRNYAETSTQGIPVVEWYPVIELDVALLMEPLSVLAAILAHELYHAAHLYLPIGVNCYWNEVHARETQALAWQEVSTGEETGRMAEMLNRDLALYHSGGLASWVRAIPLYTPLVWCQ